MWALKTKVNHCQNIYYCLYLARTSKPFMWHENNQIHSFFRLLWQVIFWWHNLVIMTFKIFWEGSDDIRHNLIFNKLFRMKKKIFNQWWKRIMLIELRFYKPHKMQLKVWHTNFDSHYRLSNMFISIALS